MRDNLIKQSLSEKQKIFAALYETVLEQEVPHKGLLLRGDASDLQHGEVLLKGAIDEGESKDRRHSFKSYTPRLWLNETSGKDVF